MRYVDIILGDMYQMLNCKVRARWMPRGLRLLQDCASGVFGHGT
jgi:hypothetical protein